MNFRMILAIPLALLALAYARLFAPEMLEGSDQ